VHGICLLIVYGTSALISAKNGREVVDILHSSLVHDASRYLILARPIWFQLVTTDKHGIH